VTNYTVLVSLDAGTTWVRHGPYQASNPDAAINQLREEHKELREIEVQHEEELDNPEIERPIPTPHYFATTRFEPVVNERELVARWSLKRLGDVAHRHEQPELG